MNYKHQSTEAMIIVDGLHEEEDEDITCHWETWTYGKVWTNIGKHWLKYGQKYPEKWGKNWATITSHVRKRRVFNGTQFYVDKQTERHLGKIILVLGATSIILI